MTRKIAYQIIRSSRKTIAIQITPAGEVVVRCPQRMPTAQIQAFLEEKQDWLRKHLEKIESHPALPRFTEAQIRELADKALKTIPQRVAYFAARLGVTYGRITIRNQVSRWGSCTSQGNLNFNCLLMLVPSEVLDYVVVHELCHIKQMNHSKVFWAEVSSVLPDYAARKKWLRQQGGELIRRLPE